jgi:parallel beta-helix repeat protein
MDFLFGHHNQNPENNEEKPFSIAPDTNAHPEGGQRMRKWKPTVVIFILVMASSFGVFIMFGAEVALGTVVGGNISVDTTWDIGGSPYIVMQNVIVDPGVKLTIDPGVQVKFEQPGFLFFSIYVEGTLHSVGNPGQPIQFTSNMPTPVFYDWESVQINASGQAEIRFSRFEYGFDEIQVYSSNNTITDCHFSFGNIGIVLRPGSSFNHIANNTIGNFGALLGLVSSSFNGIFNNTIENAAWPMFLTDSSHNLLFGNHIENSTRGIEITGDSNNNSVMNNTLINATSIAIYLGSAHNGTVENNNITKSKIGIRVGDSLKSSNHTIANNTINRCEIGISAGRGTKDSLIVGNRIGLNEKGIYLGFNVAFDSNTTIIQNDIAYNSVYGMLLENVSETLVYHNNFFNNAIQALNDNGTNAWDNGYPSGGNFWSDYGGIDVKNGPIQDQMGADGIGDTPYNFNWSSMDRYPLTEKSTGMVSAPRSINARLSGSFLENVSISWNLSWDDGYRSNNVTRYDVYRSSVYDPSRTGYLLLGSMPNGSIGFVDVFAGEGNPSNFFYYVCAVSIDNRSACSIDQVGKFTRSLSKGWNLVSIPLVVGNESIGDVFRTVSFSELRRYSGSGLNDAWQHYSSVKPYKDFSTVTVQEGYWMNVTDNSSLTIAGIVPVNVSLPLSQGWNLIGYPSMVTRQLGDLLTNVQWSRAEGFVNTSSPYFLTQVYDSDQVSPGGSLWIHVTSETTLWISDVV